MKFRIIDSLTLITFNFCRTMRVFRGLPPELLKRPSAVAIGNFDGVHLGHQCLLRMVCQAAHDRGLVPSVVTFEPHPKDFFGRGVEVARISTLYDKVLRILATGIERIYILPFRHSLASLTAEDFVKNVLIDGLHTFWMTVGEDFRFGSDRKGSVETLEAMSKTLPFEVFVQPMLFHETARISSSRIRRVLAEGNLYEAAQMLGRPYSMMGRVIHGAELGRTLGFPTLNMAPIPPGSHSDPAVHGVFAVRVKGLGHATLNGVASIGRKPTVASDGRYLLETNVFDWKGDAYGRLVEVEFVEHLRGEKKFSGLEELRAAIESDASRARRILGCPLPGDSVQ